MWQMTDNLKLQVWMKINLNWLEIRQTTNERDRPESIDAYFHIVIIGGTKHSGGGIHHNWEKK